MPAYVKSQNDRYGAALASGDTDLIARLNADAARVGYNLNPVSSLGAAGISPANPLAATVPQGGIFDNAWAYSGGGSGNYVKPSEVVEAITGTPAVQPSQNLADLGIRSGLSEWLPVAAVGAVILFVVKVIFD